MVVLTGLHLRSARALLRWKVEEVARRSRVSIEHIKRAELLDGPVKMTDAEMTAVIKVLELAGITLIEDDEAGIGSALRKENARGPGMIG
jgi:hypothetical protein